MFYQIKPKKIEEENGIIKEDEQEKVIEKNEIKKEVIIETKLQDELIVPKKMELTKDESIPPIPSPRPEEVKAPMEPVAELLPTPTKEEISVGMEPPTAVSIENSFQSPTIPVKEDLKSDTIPTTEPMPYKIEIEKIEIGEETQIEEIVHDTKEAEIVNKIKENAAFEDLTDKKLAIKTVIDDKIINSIGKEETMIIEKIEKKEGEIIFEYVKINEKKIDDVPIKETIIKKEAVTEKVREDKKLPVSEEINESIHVEEVEKEISQIDEIKIVDLEETQNARFIEEKISEISPVVTELEQDVEEVSPIEDVKEITKIKPEIVPTADLIEIEKIEPSTLPVMDIEEPISEIEREKITVEEFLPSVNAKEELLILNAITEDKIEIEKPSVTDIIQKELEIEEEPMIMDIVEEITEEKDAEIITEKKIEIPPVTEQIIQKEIEEIEEIKTTKQPVPEAEIKTEKDEKIREIQEQVIPPIELSEEREKEEIPLVEKEEISAKIALLTKEDEREEELVEEKKPELVETDLKIPTVEIKPAKIEVPIIPIDPQLLTQPYLIIAKIQEREVLQIAPAMKLPCAECCLVSKNLYNILSINSINRSLCLRARYDNNIVSDIFASFQSCSEIFCVLITADQHFEYFSFAYSNRHQPRPRNQSRLCKPTSFKPRS